MRKLLLIAMVLSMLGLLGFLSCASGDDDDDNDAADDDTGDDTGDDTAGDDDTHDWDDDVDDTGDDDDTDDDTADASFDWDTVTGIPDTLVYAGNYLGHDIVSAMAIVKISGMKFDAVEWDMIDGVPAGSYTFHIDEGENLTGDSNNYISVVFGFNALGQYDYAFISVDGDAEITSTGGVGDQFTATVSDAYFRLVDLNTGVIDWSEGSATGHIAAWAIDKTIQQLPVN